MVDFNMERSQKCVWILTGHHWLSTGRGSMDMGIGVGRIRIERQELCGLVIENARYIGHMGLVQRLIGNDMYRFVMPHHILHWKRGIWVCAHTGRGK